MQDVFQTLADATNPNKKPFNALKEADKEPINQQKEHEKSEYMKKVLFQYHEDVLNPDLPDITFTPLCESIYIRAALVGAGIGMDSAIGILSAPTVVRNETANTIADETAHEHVN